MRVEISARREERPILNASAWLLSGSDPHAWLEEIVRWRVPDELQDEIRLFVLPASRGDVSVSAVLAAPPSASTPAVRPAGVAYGLLASRLFAPVEARFDPSISRAELDALLRHDVVVFYPPVGLVGFSADQIRRPSSLLAFPRLAFSRWGAPPPVSPLNRRIGSLSLLEPVSLEEFFREETEDIGSESLNELPADPEEPAEGVVEGWKRKVLEQASGATRDLLRGAGAFGLLRGLEDWASRTLQRVTDEMERLRNKELHRLLKLLEEDAERGLRYALPLGAMAHRGRPQPGHVLPERSVDFTLRGIGGGRPADPWNVPDPLRRQLLAKYRELAAREKALGRFRRAAYIYAELLGDLETAASILKEGKHYREAAGLYRRHLGKPLEAARAYEMGGLFLEATQLYEELEKWEAAGDLYRKMDLESKATTAYSRERDRLLAERDRLGACRIVDGKLGDVEQALQILKSGWPDSSQAPQCLRRQIEIQAREGLHQHTGALLKSLEGESTSPHLVSDLASCLADMAQTYPESALRRRSADLARRKISSRIRAASKPEASRLVESLMRLAPEDRLLGRDGRRYLGRKEENRPPAAVLPQRTRVGPVLVRSIRLPAINWLSLRSTARVFFALGRDDRRLVLVRGNWNGAFEEVSWKLDGGGPPLMELDGSDERVLLWTNGLSLGSRGFAPSNVVLDSRTMAGDPGWLPAGTCGIAHRWSQWLVLRHHLGRNHLSIRTLAGVHVADIADWEADGDLAGLHLAAQNQYVVVAQARKMARSEILVFVLGQAEISTGKEQPLKQVVPMQSFVTGLRTALPNTRSRAVVTMREGVILHWLDGGGSYLVANDLREPRALFLRNGTFVVASARTFRLYGFESQRPIERFEARDAIQGGDVVDIVPGGVSDQFAALTTDGRVLLYGVPADSPGESTLRFVWP